MRTLILIFSLMLLFMFITSAIGEIYSWKDENGRTVYGDNPPENTAIKTFSPEPLMIIPGYKDPAENAKDANKTDGNDAQEETSDKEEATDEPPYTTFKITYPTKDEVIRANDGRLFMSLALSPTLAASDGIFIYVDGKMFVENSKALSIKLEQLDPGEHNMFAVVRNSKGDILVNSNTVKFSVLRNSLIQ
jgi:hypothetical protein